MSTNVTTRDTLFLLLGVILTVIIGGSIAFRLMEERRKWDVINWVGVHANDLKNLALTEQVKILSNTGIPGTIRISIPQNIENRNEIIGRIAIRLVELRCPYGVTYIDGDR